MFINNLLVMCLVVIFLYIFDDKPKTKLVVSEAGQLLWSLMLVCDGYWASWAYFLPFFLKSAIFEKLVMWYGRTLT